MPSDWEEKLMNVWRNATNSEITLVIDANILFAALLCEGKTAEIIFTPGVHLFAPHYLLAELKEHLEELARKSKRSMESTIQLIEALRLSVSLVPESTWKQFLQFVKGLGMDNQDLPYLALASILHCPVWSNDKLLKKQHLVRVYSTKELLVL